MGVVQLWLKNTTHECIGNGLIAAMIPSLPLCNLNSVCPKCNRTSGLVDVKVINLQKLLIFLVIYLTIKKPI